MRRKKKCTTDEDRVYVVGVNLQVKSDKNICKFHIFLHENEEYLRGVAHAYAVEYFWLVPGTARNERSYLDQEK